MEKSKCEVAYTVETDHKAWLESMAVKYKLPDASKALRVLLDFAMEDGDEKTIFRQIRCRHCG
jgi:hypothetical protein